MAVTHASTVGFEVLAAVLWWHSFICFLTVVLFIESYIFIWPTQHFGTFWWEYFWL